jgi:hypothetical protein
MFLLVLVTVAWCFTNDRLLPVAEIYLVCAKSLSKMKKDIRVFSLAPLAARERSP